MTATALRPDAHTRLLARIQREFDTAEETLDIAGLALRFTRIADPEAVLDDVCRQETLREQGVAPRRELRMPYWAEVWESGLALAEQLVARNGVAPIAGRRVLDLGCGMGLVGAAMAMLGARVTLADIDTAALLFARLNVQPWADRCRVVRCDWQTDDLGERFELIAGGDVLYDVSQWDAIEAFARRHLGQGGALMLGEPGRPKAAAFPEWLAARGWTLSACQASAGDKDVHLYEARVSW